MLQMKLTTMMIPLKQPSFTSSPPSSLLFLILLTTTFCISVVTGNATSFTHRLVLYECDPSRTVYRFQYDPKNHEKTELTDIVPQESLFTLKKVGSEYLVETPPDKRSTAHIDTFSFRVKNPDLIVEVTGEVRPCDTSSSTRCTVIISVLASLCLLLFAGLALTLIVLKEKRVPCLHKLTAWLQSKRGGAGGNSEDQEQQTAISKRSSALSPDEIDLEHLKRIYENGLKNNNNKSSSPAPDDSPPAVPPVNKPRKSSLKPPRTAAYLPPVLSFAPEGIQESPNGSISAPITSNINPLNSGRRKSIVTFNERTEIRS